MKKRAALVSRTLKQMGFAEARRAWFATLCLALVTAWICEIAGFRIVVTPSGITTGAALFAFWLSILAYSSLRLPKLIPPVHAIAQTIIFGILIVYLQYPSTSHAASTADSTVVAVDHALRFHWTKFFRFVLLRPYLATPLRLAYEMLIPQLPVVILAVGLLDPARLRRFVAANMIGQTICVAVSAFFPVAGAYVAHRFSFPLLYEGYPSEFVAVRMGAVHALNLPAAAGIIQFPSYHALLASLVIYAVGRAPWWIARPVQVLEAAVIVSAPVFGGHYLADILGGIASAGLAIAGAEMLCRRSEPAIARARAKTSPASAPLQGRTARHPGLIGSD